MNSSSVIHAGRGKWPIVLSIVSIVLSILAVSFSGITTYKNLLKPFELAIRVYNPIQIQYKDNLGLYLNVNFFNKSPQNGLITQVALVLYKTYSPEDKYLLTLSGLRVLKDFVYTESEEQLPLFFQPWQRSSKTMSFLYDVKGEEFPISMGTYVCELLVWTEEGMKPKYVEAFKFEITSDLLDRYKERRKGKSTTLEPINIVGYTPFKSKKLTDEEYHRFH